MVGPVSVVGSSVVDSHATPCLFLDAMSSCNLSSGDWVLQRSSFGQKRVGLLDLSTSFLDSSSIKALSGANNRKKQSKMRKLVIVYELAGQYEDTFEDVKAQLLNYFTYKAVRTVLNQLYEMNPTQYRWFYELETTGNPMLFDLHIAENIPWKAPLLIFVASNEDGYGKRFLRNLGKEKHDLAERVMVTRLHLYGKWVKKCDHTEMYERISDENLQLLRERLVETVIWPSDDTNSEVVG